MANPFRHRPSPSRAVFLASLALAVCLPAIGRAEVKPNPLLADNAVLQQGMEVPV